eukprot:12913062-Prorocentrum_lima.AAC.1
MAADNEEPTVQGYDPTWPYGAAHPDYEAPKCFQRVGRAEARYKRYMNRRARILISDLLKLLRELHDSCYEMDFGD